VQFFTQHDKDSEAEQRINRIEAFLREYPESDYKEDALSLKRTAEDAHKRWQQFQTLLSDWPQIKQECETLTIGGNSDAAVKKCVEFRTKCQQFHKSIWSSPTYKEYGDELARLLDEIDKTGDQCQWRGVELYTARNPSNYDEIIKRAKAYKDSTTFATKYFEKAADKLMIQTLRSEWSQIQVECENLTNGGNSDAAVEKCEEFRTKCQQFQQSVWSSPTDKEYSDELARLLDEIDKTGDQYQWRGVKLYADRNRSHYEQIIEKAEAYKTAKSSPLRVMIRQRIVSSKRRLRAGTPHCITVFGTLPSTPLVWQSRPTIWSERPAHLKMRPS
jgi:uncharacterized protein YaaR (DUF327 family)